MRRRLAVAILAVAAGAVVLFAVPLGLALRHVYRDEETLRLERDTVAATRVIDVRPGVSTDPIEIPVSGDRRAVYDRRGRLLAGTSRPADAAVAGDALRTGRPVVRDLGRTIVTGVPILRGERVTGALVAARPDTAAAQDSRQAWVLLAALAGAVMLAAVLAALVLARGLARPLEVLAASARRLGMGDFSARAPGSSVAEVDAVAAALDTTAERLGDMVSRERAFSADASHQLRTPLAALRIELEAAQLRGERPDPAVALRQVERLEQTIATLLAVARDRPAGTNEADLVSIAERLESEWRPRLADDGRRLSLEFGAEALAADAHAGVVQEVLGVLLDNAARHGAGTVTLSLRARDGWAQVDVTDEGAGFGADPESALERGNSRNGHGIGLALARSLADAEGGRLTIADPGPRPTVRLLLRLAAARMG